MALATGSLYLLREAGALVSAGISAGSIWPGGAYAANPPAMPNLPWRYVARNAPAPMPPIPTMTQSAPGRLSIAGWIADQEAGDAQSDAMWQAQRDADWASQHAGPPGTVVPPMPDTFEPAPPGVQPPPFSAAYYAQLNAQNATAPPGTTVASVPGGGTYYNPPAPAPALPLRGPRIVPIPIGLPSTSTPVPTSQPPSTTVIVNPPPAARVPPSIDTATTPSGGGAGAGAPASATPWLVGGAIVLGLIYFGRKKKRGR